MSKTAVVILNWNGVQFLEQFLPSVTSHSQEADIVVIDNASTDNSLSFLAEYYPQVQTVCLDKNYGFAGGYNKGLQSVKATYYVLLNSDVAVTANWLTPLTSLLDQQADIGAVQPKILAFHDKKSFEYAGACGGFIDRYGYPFCRGRVFNIVEQDQKQYDNATEVFWATGAALTIRASLFHQLGGFDDDFFAHMEEIDLCWRIKKSGYKIVCEPQSTVYHVGGGTLPNNSPFKLYLNFRNSLFMLFKNLPTTQLLSRILTRMLLDGVATFKFALTGEWKNAFAVLRSHYAFYLALPQLLKKRKQINKQTTAVPLSSNTQGAIDKSILWLFFIKKQHYFSEIYKQKTNT